MAQSEAARELDQEIAAKAADRPLASNTQNDRSAFEGTLRSGTRIYYTGDMANSEDFGTIDKHYSNQWGTFVDVTLDDGRVFRGLHTVGFSPRYSGNGSTRLVTEAAYRAWRADRLALLRA